MFIRSLIAALVALTVTACGSTEPPPVPEPTRVVPVEPRSDELSYELSTLALTSTWSSYSISDRVMLCSFWNEDRERALAAFYSGQTEGRQINHAAAEDFFDDECSR